MNKKKIKDFINYVLLCIKFKKKEENCIDKYF